MGYKKLLLFILLISTVLVSCKKKSDKLADSIPASAQSVTYVNMQSLIQKSNYNIMENSAVKRGLNMAKAMLKDEGAVKILEDFEKNSGAFGITLNREAYLFSSGNYSGFVVPVDNEDKIKEALLKFKVVEEASITKEKGAYFISSDPALSIAWDKHKFIALFKWGGNQDTTSLSARRLLSQNEKESILADVNYQKFDKEKTDISVYLSSGMYAELGANISFFNHSRFAKSSNEEMATYLKKVSEQFKGISIGLYTSFDEGKITTSSKYFFQTNKEESNLKDLVKSSTGELTDKYLQYIAANPIFAGAFSLKGSGYYTLLSKMGLFDSTQKELAESGIDLKSLMESINGNIVFALNGMTVAPKNPNISDLDAMLNMQDNSAKTSVDFSLIAELSPQNNIAHFIDSLISKQPKGMILKTGEGQYSIKNKDYNGVFGVKDNAFYFSTNQDFASKFNSSIVKSSFSNKAKGNCGFIYGDFRTLHKYAKDYAKNALLPSQAYISQLVDGLLMLETIEMHSKLDMTSELTINFVNKKENSLAAICKFVDGVLTKVSSQML